LELKSPQKYDIIPDSDFTIKRTAYKDNSSDYFIDDRKTTFKEVGTLLRECGVDLDHNRFLILQGEVESISLLKPKSTNDHDEGLLEYLEDIIGTINYKPMLEDAAVEIDKINEIRAEKSNRVANLLKDKNSMEGPKNEAVNYLKMENKLIETKNIYYQVKINEKNEKVSERKEAYENMQAEMNELKSKLDEFSKQNEAALSECTLKKKEFEKKSKTSEKLKKKFENFEREDIEIRAGIKHAKEQLKKLQKSIEAETEKIKNFQDLPEKNSKEIEEIQMEIDELNTKLEPANQLIKEKMDQVNEETIRYQEKKNKLQEKLSDLQNTSNEAKLKMNVAQSEYDVATNTQSYDKTKLEETRIKLKELETLIQQRDAGIKQLEDKDVPSLKTELGKAKSELIKINEKEKQININVNKSREKFSEAQSSFSTNRSRNRVLNFLMQAKAEGKLDGLLGRLGDLGAIDEKYDCAVSTACGALDNILVDNIDTARKCIKLLKESGIGSATFIGLDKQAKWKEHLDKKSNFPENVSRLVDLIKVNDPKLKTAFYYSLRNTLVANDLEQATRIAYSKDGRNRVVTLRGEIIETSGTMSGGGTPLKGRMGSKLRSEYSSDQVGTLKEKLRSDEAELSELQERRQELESEIERLTNQLEKAKENLIRWKDEIGPLKQQVQHMKKTQADCLQKLKEIKAPDKDHLTKMESELFYWNKFDTFFEIELFCFHF
jgi:structural maintenance of chromosome 4